MTARLGKKTHEASVSVGHAYQETEGMQNMEQKRRVNRKSLTAV